MLLWQASLVLVFSRENTVQPTFGLHAYTKLPLPYTDPGLLFLHQPVLRIPPSGHKEQEKGVGTTAINNVEPQAICFFSLLVTSGLAHD